MATTSAYPTPAEILKQARAIAAQELAAARAPVDQQAADAAKANAQHGEAIQGFSGALADILGGIQPQVKTAYDDGSTRTATFAKGFSDGLRMKTQGSADQTNQYLHDVVGAPEGQMVSPDTATAAGDVAYGLGGYIPASALAREGAAYESAAAALPGYARLRGQQDFTSNLFAGRDEAKQFANQISTLFAGKPKLVNDLYQQLQQLQTTNRAADVNRAIAITQLTGEVTPQAAALLGIPKGTKTAAVKTAEARVKAKVQATADKNALPDTSLSRAKGYVVDSTGAAIPDATGNVQLLPGYKVGKNGRVVKMSTTKPKVLSPSDRQHLEKQAELYYYGKQPQQQFNQKTQTWMDVPGTGVPAVDYSAAVRGLMDGFGLSRKQAERYANAYYQAGEDGRPLSAAQKAAAKKERSTRTRAKKAITSPTSLLTGGGN